MLRRFAALDGWTKVVVLFLWGAMFIGKAGAYAGIAIGGLLLLSHRVLWDRCYVALTRRSDPLHGFCWALLVSLLYGFAETVYGVLLGYKTSTIFLVLVFNLGPVYLLLGIWVGKLHPTLPRKYIRFMAWYAAFYTPLYFLVLKHFQASIGSFAGSPQSGSVQLIGLIAFEPVLVKLWFPIAVLTGLIIVNQERADWLGLILALGLWGKLSGRISRVIGIFSFVVLVLAFAALIDLKLPPIPGRGGELSARGTISRIAGSVSPEMAASVGGDQAHAGFYYGTVYWRKRWWANIRQEVGRSTGSTLFGLGYGYPLATLASKAVEKEGTRSPHSIFYFTLAYSGLFGAAIFFWLQYSVIRVLHRSYKTTGELFGPAYYVYTLSGAFFGNFLETPAGISFYLVLGLTIGNMFNVPEAEPEEFEFEPEFEEREEFEPIPALHGLAKNY